MAVFEHIENAGVIPHIAGGPAQAARGGAAVFGGGAEIMEIDSRAVRPDELAAVCRALPGMLVGAGNVTGEEAAAAYVQAGAAFISSPGWNSVLAAACRSKGLPLIPTCSTDAEFAAACEMGFEAVYCLLPPVGGGVLRRLTGEYPALRMIAAFSKEPACMAVYAQNPAVLALAGEWICPAALYADGSPDAAGERVRCVIRKMLGFDIAHVGINASGDDEARQISGRLADILGLPVYDEGTSYFVSALAEVNKQPGRGVGGHLGICSHNLKRAIHFIRKNGMEIDTRPFDEGKPGPLYLAEEVGGFAIHLVQPPCSHLK